jgi:isocitrate dehydrogenase kinase/phosphatase
MSTRPRASNRIRTKPDPEVRHKAQETAQFIRVAFDEYSAEFLRITRRAQQRFEHRDWKGRHSDAMERLDLYEKALEEVAMGMTQILGPIADNRSVWAIVKREFAHIIDHRHDAELAETFFNSVTRKILMTIGIDREIEFFSLNGGPQVSMRDEPVYRHYPNPGSTRDLVKSMLLDHRFGVEFQDIDGDSLKVAREVDLYLWPVIGFGSFESIDVIRAPFYRNKVAYIVGRINAGEKIVPLVLPLYNGEFGVYVDTVLLNEAEVSIVFSFAHSYFHVEVERHDALIELLRSILPQKPVAELYTSLGYSKQGKTEFYRDLHHFVHESREKFVIAPGKEGAVMIGFTLPDFGYVFKVIKDRPCFLRSSEVTDKRSTRPEVMRQYDLVCHRDRVGRLVDTQEFENLRFKKKRFSEPLLREFNLAAREVVKVESDYVVINHAYVQRKVIPLPMFLLQEKDPEEIRRVIIDFGYFLKDLAATGIFPYDLFNIWNYGVTRRGRVVLFDYDDVQPLEKTRFKEKPVPRDAVDELLAEEDRIASLPDDFFMDEIERYSGIPRPLKGVFEATHGDLFTLDFWKDMQRRIRRGEIVDITPYDRAKRFPRQQGL